YFHFTLSFPTRRSSDLNVGRILHFQISHCNLQFLFLLLPFLLPPIELPLHFCHILHHFLNQIAVALSRFDQSFASRDIFHTNPTDRKLTRLNSSHISIP